MGDGELDEEALNNMIDNLNEDDLPNTNLPDPDLDPKAAEAQP